MNPNDTAAIDSYDRRARYFGHPDQAGSDERDWRDDDDQEEDEDDGDDD